VASGRPTRRYRYATPFRTTWVSDGSSVYWVASPAIVSTGANGLPGSERNTIHCAGGWGGGLQRSAVLEPRRWARRPPRAETRTGRTGRGRGESERRGSCGRRGATPGGGLQRHPVSAARSRHSGNRAESITPSGSSWVNRRSFETDGRRWLPGCQAATRSRLDHLDVRAREEGPRPVAEVHFQNAHLGSVSRGISSGGRAVTRPILPK